MSTVSRTLIEQWLMPDLVGSDDIAGAWHGKPEDYAKPPRPHDSRGRAGFPFAWVYYDAPPQIETTELNGTVFERVFPVVDLAFRIDRRDTDIAEEGDRIAAEAHAAIMRRSRYEPETLPGGVLMVDLAEQSVDATPAKGIGLVRLTYNVLTRRSHFDLTATAAA